MKKPTLDLKEILKTLGMSTIELAVAIGVREYTVERWQRGESRPSPLACQALKKVVEQKFGCSPSFENLMVRP